MMRGGGRYGDAVRRCVNCEFDQKKPSFEVESFREAFYKGAIQPLEEDLADFCNISSAQSMLD